VKLTRKPRNNNRTAANTLKNGLNPCRSAKPPKNSMGIVSLNPSYMCKIGFRLPSASESYKTHHSNPMLLAIHEQAR